MPNKIYNNKDKKRLQQLSASTLHAELAYHAPPMNPSIRNLSTRDSILSLTYCSIRVSLSGDTWHLSSVILRPFNNGPPVSSTRYTFEQRTPIPTTVPLQLSRISLLRDAAKFLGPHWPPPLRWTVHSTWNESNSFTHKEESQLCHPWGADL